ncbi:hypothetical protein [Labrenzia sp. VG12]|uniref:hypothetical protein n=1 Tax=Labrenzia sp. VG12 TaxID=2021862 RepID=UPI000B8C2505|nr:hypothetical protein [Labrenzia sp. VG12]ASP32243.1 hypothetical protein CHH27_02460 [Labrenzia sp. VG12]
MTERETVLIHGEEMEVDKEDAAVLHKIQAYSAYGAWLGIAVSIAGGWYLGSILTGVAGVIGSFILAALVQLAAKQSFMAKELRRQQARGD